MSKAEVKKYIKSLERGSLEELVMDLYSARKEAKEYLVLSTRRGRLSAERIRPNCLSQKWKTSQR